MPISMCQCKGSDRCEYQCPNPQLSYEGAVLGKREANGYHDSDFYATVWDGQNVCEVCYASTRGWTYHNSAKIDATPEVLAAALDWYRPHWVDLQVARAERERQRLYRGVTVEVTAGKHKGLTGEVVWYGVDEYRSTRWTTVYRVGIRSHDERSRAVFVSADNVRRTDAPPVDVEAIRRKSQTLTAPLWGTVHESLFQGHMSTVR